MSGQPPPPPDDGQWRDQSFRQNMVSKLETAILESGTTTSKTALEMESQVFSKATSKNEYLSFTARLIIHIHEIAPKGNKGGQTYSQVVGQLQGRQHVIGQGNPVTQMNPIEMGSIGPMNMSPQGEHMQQAQGTQLSQNVGGIMDQQGQRGVIVSQQHGTIISQVGQTGLLGQQNEGNLMGLPGQEGAMGQQGVPNGVQVKAHLVLGHRASIRKEPMTIGFTHDFEVYVQGNQEGSKIDKFVKKVIFTLPRSYPNYRRVVKAPPYIIKESVSTGLNIKVEVRFRNHEKPKSAKFNYTMYLPVPSEGPLISASRRETLTFNYPGEAFKKMLVEGGGIVVTDPDNSEAHGSGSSSQVQSKSLTSSSHKCGHSHTGFGRKKAKAKATPTLPAVSTTNVPRTGAVLTNNLPESSPMVSLSLSAKTSTETTCSFAVVEGVNVEQRMQTEDPIASTSRNVPTTVTEIGLSNMSCSAEVSVSESSSVSAQNQDELQVDAVPLDREEEGSSTNSRKWRDGKSIGQMMESVLDQDEGGMKDVTFVVGPNLERISAHKLFLSVVSPVFEYAFYLSPNAQNRDPRKPLIISLPDVNPEAFRLVLRYIYMRQLKFDNITKDTVDILKLAHEFQLPHLTVKCMTVLRSGINMGNAVYILQQAYECNQTRLQEFAIKFVLQNASKIFATAGFLDLSLECLCLLLENDNLNAWEVDIFHAAVRWAEDRIIKRLGLRGDIKINGSDILTELGRAIYLIRFPLLLPKNFVPIAQRNILSSADAVIIFTYLNAEVKPDPQPFSSQPRIWTDAQYNPTLAAATSTSASDTDNGTTPTVRVKVEGSSVSDTYEDDGSNQQEGGNEAAEMSGSNNTLPIVFEVDGFVGAVSIEEPGTESSNPQEKEEGTTHNDERNEPSTKRARHATSPKLKATMQNLMDIVVNYKNDEGRVLSDAFMLLPSKILYPDYYAVVKTPIDITTMLNKIGTGVYVDLDEVAKDFMQLYTNGQRYYSIAYPNFTDAAVLWSVFAETRDRLEQEMGNTSTITIQQQQQHASNSIPIIPQIQIAIPDVQASNIIAENSMLQMDETMNNQNEVGRTVIWHGLLEWKWHEKQTEEGSPPGPIITRRVSCSVSARLFNQEPDVKSDGWPEKLVMKLIPKSIFDIGARYGYYTDAKTVQFKLEGDLLASLTQAMTTGFVGFVHSTTSEMVNASPSEGIVMMLVYSKEKQTYFGLIPPDQKEFLHLMLTEIQKQRNQH